MLYGALLEMIVVFLGTTASNIDKRKKEGDYRKITEKLELSSETGTLTYTQLAAVYG